MTLWDSIKGACSIYVRCVNVVEETGLSKLNANMEVRAMDKGVTAGILITLVFSFVTTGYAQKVDRSILLNDYQVFQTPVLLRLSDQTHLSGATDTESRKQKGERPPLSAMKITGEVLTGGVAAAVGTFLMRQWIAPEEGEEWSDNFGLFALMASFAAGGLVNCVSSATGVYIVGNTDNETASFETTLEGSIIGLFAGWAFFPLCAGKSTDGARFLAGLDERLLLELEPLRDLVAHEFLPGLV